MQTISPRIWTYVAVSISYDGRNYTTNAAIPCEKMKERVIKDLHEFGLMIT